MSGCQTSVRAERLIPPPRARSIRGQPRLRKGCVVFISFHSERADGKQAALTVVEEAVKEGVVLLAEDVVGKF